MNELVGFRSVMRINGVLSNDNKLYVGAQDTPLYEIAGGLQIGLISRMVMLLLKETMALVRN